MVERATLPQFNVEPAFRHRVDLPTLIRYANDLRETGRAREAQAIYSEILAQRPDNLYAAIGKMRTHFYLEEWDKAWPALDIRFRFMDQPPSVSGRNSAGETVIKPRWTGGSAPASLLVLDEQGMGDTIQFMRFLPRLVAAGTRVTFVTHRRLFGLIRSMDAPIELRAMDVAGSVAGIDSWTPLLNLPGAMGLQGADLGMERPYIAAEPTRVQRWRDWLGQTGFRVGIAWQGNPKAPVDAGRSSPLAALSPLASLPGVRLISLQNGVGADQLSTVPFGSRIEVPGPDFDAGPDAFLDTAALMMSLDLVVTVDSAVAHVAAALGRPVIFALQERDADWRWIPGQSTTRWYPSATLMHQDTHGDWWSAFVKIAAEVRRRSERPAHGGCQPMTPVSVGELFDKISILQIKRERLPAGSKRDNVLKELAALEAVVASEALGGAEMDALRRDLKVVNEALWDIEDDIRRCEAVGDFGSRFIELARAVYVTNDRRAVIKSDLNTLSGSALREEKSYAAFR
ncbi:MAG: hypothetical protein LCH61_05450 [Proteobacteria bacterium]|nr:hypothetical protein [Pseudomonadota bacterium]